MHIQVIQNTQASITSYGNESITINEKKYRQSVFITSINIHELNNNITHIDHVSCIDLPDLASIDLLLIGGKNLSPLSSPLNLKTKLYLENISLEVMSIGAACRTFNLLLSEGREVGCLILF